MTAPGEKRKIGFALLSPERRVEIAAKGGRSAHEQGVAHEFAPGSEEARAAGRKGGRASHAKKQDRQEKKT